MNGLLALKTVALGSPAVAWMIETSTPPDKMPDDMPGVGTLLFLQSVINISHGTAIPEDPGL